MTTLKLEAPLLTLTLAVPLEREKDAPTATQSHGATPVQLPPPFAQSSISPSEQQLDDQGLIAAICEGAEWAMDQLYQCYSRHAYALAYRIVHDSTTAEDIVQDAFFSVWRKAPSYQKQHGSVYSWLQAIVHHRAIDKIRSAAHRDQQWKTLERENEQEPQSQQPEVWEQVWHTEQRTLISKALAQLPIEQRHVIEQAYFGGCTHAEIAERWHIPLGTVKGRMRLGIQKMKLLLQQYGLEGA